MHKRIRPWLGVLLAFGTVLAHAASGNRTGVITDMQMDSATTAGYESVLYLSQDAQWSGSVNCDATWAYFNSKVNPHFAATVIAARLTATSIRVTVDDSLPKLGNICQINNVKM